MSRARAATGQECAAGRVSQEPAVLQSSSVVLLIVLAFVEGEILDYTTELQRQNLEPPAAMRMTSAEIVAVRHALQSAKSPKDVRHNLKSYLLDEPDGSSRVRQIGRELASTYREITELWAHRRGERSLSTAGGAGCGQPDALRGGAASGESAPFPGPCGPRRGLD